MRGSTGFAWETATTLASFLRPIKPLAAADRALIVDQAILLLDNYYVHLPEKKARYNIDPIARLNALRAGLSTITEDRDFHHELSQIFAELHDLHTQYSLPDPYPTAAALLPFKVGTYLDHGETRYVVTDIIRDGFQAPLGFRKGAEILTWCGLPINQAVAAAAARTGGTSDEARLARGLAAMTLRPLERQPPPEATEVTMTYRTAHAQGTLTCPWRVVHIKKEQRVPALARFVNLDHEGEIRRRASKHAYHPKVIQAEHQHASTGARQRPYPDSGALETDFPSIFYARPIDARFGYIRIFSFNVPVEDPSIEVLVARFAGEFIRLIEQLPPDGLVIDVRGNGGGFMPMAEGILQTLTPRTIVPQSLELRATPAVVALSRNAPDLGDYVASLGLAADGYSAAIPMSKPDWCNNIGQKYHGPVLLIIDARCYSATDAFAAGFQDHAIGPILGTSGSTGAGGANVWTLSAFPAFAGSGLVACLPRGASLRVALRRTRRVGPREGKLVEDDGVTPDEVHEVTLGDLLEDDRDLLAHAVRMLRAGSGAP